MYDSAEVIASAYRDAPAETALDRMLYADIVTRLPEHSLMLTDRMSMANSLELRAPLLDHRLMEFMATAPDGLKIRGRRTKHLLRSLAGEYLPDRIVRRGKQGFMFPVAAWFAGPLYPALSDILGRSRFVKEGLFRASYIERLLEEHRGRRVDHHVRLWMLLNVELWRRMYIDGESPALLEEELAGRR